MFSYFSFHLAHKLHNIILEHVLLLVVDDDISSHTDSAGGATEVDSVGQLFGSIGFKWVVV